MQCPNCRFEGVVGDECPRCGVIIDKFVNRGSRASAGRTASQSAAPQPGGRPSPPPVPGAGLRHANPGRIILNIVLGFVTTGLFFFYLMTVLAMDQGTPVSFRIGQAMGALVIPMILIAWWQKRGTLTFLRASFVLCLFLVIGVLANLGDIVEAQLKPVAYRVVHSATSAVTFEIPQQWQIEEKNDEDLMASLLAFSPNEHASVNITLIGQPQVSDFDALFDRLEQTYSEAFDEFSLVAREATVHSSHQSAARMTYSCLSEGAKIKGVTLVLQEPDNALAPLLMAQGFVTARLESRYLPVVEKIQDSIRYDVGSVSQAPE